MSTFVCCPADRDAGPTRHDGHGHHRRWPVKVLGKTKLRQGQEEEVRQGRAADRQGRRASRPARRCASGSATRRSPRAWPTRTARSRPSSGSRASWPRPGPAQGRRDRRVQGPAQGHGVLPRASDDSDRRPSGSSPRPSWPRRRRRPASPARPHRVAAVCEPGGGVSVVVDFRELGGGMQTVCDADGAARPRRPADRPARLPADLRAAPAGLRVPGQRGCRPADPCVNTPPTTAYWGLYWSNGTSGSWTYSSLGA